MRAALFLILATAAAFAEDPVASLSQRIDEGKAQLRFDPAYGYLPALLEALHVPVESQMAVFSKTSIQSMRIEPSNPRVLYFNDAVSVGWVRGGFIEMAAQDPGRGTNFYILMQRPDERITRRTDCVKCHQSSKLLLRSVTASPFGVTSDAIDIDGRTPFERMWGGWFVTGSKVPPMHRGNAVFEKSIRREVEPLLDPKFSLTPSSDVVALMVFAHQMRMTNLLADPGDVSELVDYLLFADEGELPGKIAGESGFAEKFAAEGPRDSQGRSLRDFDLKHRLMRYPCSYMIYSKDFDTLSPSLKEAVYRRIWGILSGEIHSGLPLEKRLAAVEILRETKANLPDYFEGPIR